MVSRSIYPSQFHFSKILSALIYLWNISSNLVLLDLGGVLIDLVGDTLRSRTAVCQVVLDTKVIFRSCIVFNQ